MEKGYYVYRFMGNDGEILYVGRTIDMEQRVKTHFSSAGHLNSECYERTLKVEYIGLPTKIDMVIKELYYINKWKPSYNTKDKQDSDMEVEIDETVDNWIEYKRGEQYYRDKCEELEYALKQQKEMLGIEIEGLRRQLATAKAPISNIQVTPNESRSFSYENAIEIIKKDNNIELIAVSFDRSNMTHSRTVRMFAENGCIYAESKVYHTALSQRDHKEREQVYPRLGLEEKVNHRVLIYAEAANAYYLTDGTDFDYAVGLINESVRNLMNFNIFSEVGIA